MPDVAPIVNDDDHLCVDREQSLQVLDSHTAAFITTENTISEYLAIRVDYFGDILGICSGTHGVNVKLVEL